jgi:hypothetical protein
MFSPINLLIILCYCICLDAEGTVIVVSIIEIIAIIVIIVCDIFVTTVVPDDDHVPGCQELYEEPRDDPSGTRTPSTPDVSPSHDPPAMAQLRPLSIPADKFCEVSI